MQVNSVQLTNFRNYSNLNLALDPGLNIFTGQNGNGKTNFLEAVYIISSFKSFRALKVSDCIMYDKAFFNISAQFNGFGFDKCMDVTLKRDESKVITYNGEKVSRFSEIFGELCCVVFSPSDLEMVKREPGLRRRFLDMSIGQVSKSYIGLLKNYNRALKQKSFALRTGIVETLPAWNEQLCISGEQIVDKRQQFVEKLNAVAKDIYKSIAGNEDFQVEYNPNICGKAYAQTLEKQMKREILLKSCQYGAQRDDLSFYINGKNIKYYASQGQQRTAALSLKAAQTKIIQNTLNEPPILLLDDCMSELDCARREFLSHLLTKTQALITCTEQSMLPNLPNARFYNVLNGIID